MKIQELRDIQAVVIGAGPSGLACVKELIKLKKKVLLIHISESNKFIVGGTAIDWHSQCAIYEEQEFLSHDIFDKWPVRYEEYTRYVKEVEKLLKVHTQVNNNEQFIEGFDGNANIQIHRVQTIVGTSKPWSDIFKQDIQNPLLEIIHGDVEYLTHHEKVNGIVMRGEKKLLLDSAKIYLAAGCVGNTEILGRSKIKILNNSKVFGKYLSDHPMFESVTFTGGNRSKFFPLFENKRYLRISQLNKNKYRVKVDGKVIGVFEIRHFFTKRSLLQASRLTFVEFFRQSINFLGQRCFNFIFFRPLESQLWIQLAQEQNPNSRIIHENQKFTVYWKLIEQDLLNFHEIRRSAEILLGEWGFVVEKQNTIQNLEDLQRLAIPAYHPSGTTRMHNNSDLAVVDGNGKFIGLDNLFLCGSSTFPTPSWVNPTLTSMALSTRTVRLSN